MSSPVICTVDFDEFQNAFADGHITLQQFVDVLRDNLGPIKTRAILKKNLKEALKENYGRLEKGELRRTLDMLCN